MLKNAMTKNDVKPIQFLNLLCEKAGVTSKLFYLPLIMGALMLLHDVWVPERVFLENAAIYGHEGMVRMMLGKQTERNGRKALFEPFIAAVRHGHPATASIFLDHGIDINAALPTGHTPLMEAAWRGHVDTVRMLLLRGADIEAVDNNGRTALMHAAQHGRKDCVDFFLRSGAYVGAVDKKGWTAFRSAAASGHVEIAKALLESGAKLQPIALNDAAYAGRAKMVQFLLEHGVPTDASPDGMTALMHAAGQGHVDVVRLLIKRGADVNMVNRRGVTALGVALTGKYRSELKKNHRVIKLLIEAGADIQPALVPAVRSGNLEAVEFLRSRGASLDEVGKDGSTVLMQAVLAGHQNIVRFLLAEGADVYAVSPDGSTALSLAMKNGNKEVAKMLSYAMCGG